MRHYDGRAGVRKDSGTLGGRKNVVDRVQYPDPRNYGEIMKSEIKKEPAIPLAEELVMFRITQYECFSNHHSRATSYTPNGTIKIRDVPKISSNI